MLISQRNDIDDTEFEKLISRTTSALQETAKNESGRYVKLLGNKLEDEVHKLMCECALGTPFEGTIELVSGQKFPSSYINSYCVLCKFNSAKPGKASVQ